MPPPPPAAGFAYTVDPSLAAFDVPPAAWMCAHGVAGTWDGLAVSVVVLDADGRVLLVQRAAHDSMPNQWEPPGGGASEEDVDGGSVLRAAARELWEETGLTATHFAAVVPLRRSDATDCLVHPAAGDAGDTAPHPGHLFYNSTGKRLFCRFTFRATVRATAPIVLDPQEHQAYVWASQDEVRAGRRHDGTALPLTGAATESFLLEAFRQTEATRRTL